MSVHLGTGSGRVTGRTRRPGGEQVSTTPGDARAPRAARLWTGSDRTS